MRRNKLARSVGGTVLLWAVAQAAGAAAVMPDFANLPTGWTTDRYDPASFSNVGSYQGRSDVLGIGITSAGDLANRAAPYQSTFYNTQGRQHAITGGANSVLAADLYINSGWANAANGNVRTDMWGVLSDAGSAVTDYGIVGFTNYGGAARLRVYDSDLAGGWFDVAAPVAYDAWTAFEIRFTGTSLDYYINGTSVYSDSTLGGTQFTATIMQAYNFADPSISNATLADYTAHWSNAQPQVDGTLPEPSSLALVGLALFGAAATARKRR